MAQKAIFLCILNYSELFQNFNTFSCPTAKFLQ